MTRFNGDRAEPGAVHEKVARLQVLGRAELLARWQRAYGRPAPKRISRELLVLALAYRIQEQTVGGLSKAALKRLNRPGGVDVVETPSPRPAAPRLKPGTRLVREWHGEVHHVTVDADGLAYRGQRYRSLSQIARNITGTPWSGPLFFGLRKTTPRLEVADGD